MRSHEFVTPFWKNALMSLPKPLQERYSLQLHAAERWELGFATVFQTLSDARDAFARLFHQPKEAH